MTVYEAELPGVGRKYELELDDGSRVIVVVHHDGRREVYRRSSPDADSAKCFDFSAQDARRFAAMLQGTGFETVDVAALEVPVGDAIIEWTELEAGSALIGQTIGEADLRARTGVSIVAIQREDQTIERPDADFEMRAGDVLVGLGTRAEQAELDELT